MKFRPLHNYGLVKPDPQNLSKMLVVVHERQRNEGGIIGTVLAMGPGKWEDRIFVPTQAKVGERVMLQDCIDYPKLGDAIVIQDADVACVLES